MPHCLPIELLAHMILNQLHVNLIMIIIIRFYHRHHPVFIKTQLMIKFKSSEQITLIQCLRSVRQFILH